METSEILDSLPVINVLEEEGITPESIVEEMVEDYQNQYEEITGEELTLYPGDERKIQINAVASILYQLASIGQERFRQNFLKTAHGDALKNLGANIGFYEDGLEKARTTLRFSLSEKQEKDITIPEGTRATAGDQVYFATEENTVIKAGELFADTSAVCEEAGSIGNGYTKGQINTIVDPVNCVENVTNIDETLGGNDEYTNDELRKKIFEFPSSYSSAGSEDAYIYMVKQYSNNIKDVRVISDNATVRIYILMQDGKIPDEAYIEEVKTYLLETKKFPDTDKIEVCAPEIIEYELTETYYIPYESKDTEESIKEAVDEATNEFIDYTQSKIGRSVDPGILNAFIRVAGARVEITSPVYSKIGRYQVAKCSNVSINYAGLEKE